MRWIWCFPIFWATVWAVEGEAIYRSQCAVCHKLYVPAKKLMSNFFDHNNTLLHLKAPTINQLAYRMKSRVGDPTGDKDIQLMEIQAFMRDYLLRPDRQKSICEPEVLKFFKTMPSMAGKIDEEQINAVAEWIFFFQPPARHVRDIEYVDFDRAIALAKRTGKLIMIEATSPGCHYCRKMERTTLKDPTVMAEISNHFVPVRVDVSEKKLPAGLQWQMTPTFFFLDAQGRLIKKIPGAWMKDDFLQILHEVVKGVKG